jgi:hypothetical protein
MLQQVLLPTCSDSRACTRCMHLANAAYLCQRCLSLSCGPAQHLDVHATQTAEHSLVKVHVHVQSTRVGQHLIDAKPGALHHQACPPQCSMEPSQHMSMHVVPAPPGVPPTVQHAARSTHGYTCCASSLSLTCSRAGRICYN